MSLNHTDRHFSFIVSLVVVRFKPVECSVKCFSPSGLLTSNMYVKQYCENLAVFLISICDAAVSG